MTEQEYKEKIQVREQLSQLDRLRVLEYELQKLAKDVNWIHEQMGNVKA
jgi:hypothetical protein